jgi:hypothetical protein
MAGPFGLVIYGVRRSRVPRLITRPSVQRLKNTRLVRRKHNAHAAAAAEATAFCAARGQYNS